LAGITHLAVGTIYNVVAGGHRGANAYRKVEAALHLPAGTLHPKNAASANENLERRSRNDRRGDQPRKNPTQRIEERKQYDDN
jgi:hypothetical protein